MYMITFSMPWDAYMHQQIIRSLHGSIDGFSPIRRQGNIWDQAGMSVIGPLITNFSEICDKI